MQQFPVWRFLWDGILDLDSFMGNDLQIGSKRELV